jgi:hypothetical protein
VFEADNIPALVGGAHIGMAPSAMDSAEAVRWLEMHKVFPHRDEPPLLGDYPDRDEMVGRVTAARMRLNRGPVNV